MGDFSRGNTDILASEPNLFELRVPVESATDLRPGNCRPVFKGFEEIHQSIARDENLLKQRSPGAALAFLFWHKGTRKPVFSIRHAIRQRQRCADAAALLGMQLIPSVHRRHRIELRCSPTSLVMFS